MVGAAYAYGNSSEVPYAEQFYVGGANSIRAFTVRSIGPGSYKAPDWISNSYFDQTGTFKFEFNVEYRFPIIGPLNGALFIDAGNVWLLKKDPLRPGGELRAKTFLRDIALAPAPACVSTSVCSCSAATSASASTLPTTPATADTTTWNRSGNRSTSTSP